MLSINLIKSISLHLINLDLRAKKKKQNLIKFSQNGFNKYFELSIFLAMISYLYTMLQTTFHRLSNIVSVF